MLERFVRIWTEAASLDRASLPLECALSGALLVEIERRVDLEALLVELLAELRVELFADPFNEVRGGLASRRLVGQLQWVSSGPTRVCLADLSLLLHQLD